MRLLLLASICLITSGCIYLDTTMLDTAEPLRAGKPSVTAYTGQGIDVDTAVHIPGIPDDTEGDSDTNPEKHVENGGVQGAKAAIGLGDDYELGFRAWVGEGQGFKANIKKRFYNQDGYSIAVSPSVYQLTKEDEGTKYLYGVELPVMLTYRPGKLMAATFEAHYAIDSYSRDYEVPNGQGTQSYGPYRLHHFGGLAGLKLTVWHISVLGELGVERVLAVNGPDSNVGVGGFGISVDF